MANLLLLIAQSYAVQSTAMLCLQYNKEYAVYSAAIRQYDNTDKSIYTATSLSGTATH